MKARRPSVTFRQAKSDRPLAPPDGLTGFTTDAKALVSKRGMQIGSEESRRFQSGTVDKRSERLWHLRALGAGRQSFHKSHSTDQILKASEFGRLPRLHGAPRAFVAQAAYELSITERWEKAIYLVLFGCFLALLGANL